MSSDKHDENQRVQDAYNRILRDQMNMAMNPLQNASAQGSILGSFANQAVGSVPGSQRRIESMFDHNRQLQMNIINADNGFILVMRPDHPGSRDRVLVASTIEELRDLFTSELVSRKMEK
jgi:hypothetical protein